METTIQQESREYPSRLFFVDLLLKEVLNASESGKDLTEILEKLRVIWTISNREAVLRHLENRINQHRHQKDVHEQVAGTLTELVSVADKLKPRDRQNVDFAISRIIKYLDTDLQMNVIAPWLQESRKFRCKTALRCVGRQKDLSPYADFLVEQFRAQQGIDTLKLIARSREAARQISPAELEPFLLPYMNRAETSYDGIGRDRKYPAMIAAKVLIVGEQTIPKHLLQSTPEIFTWAIDDLGDPQYEAMLIWLIVEHAENPQVLWSAIRTASSRFMPRALERGVDTAKQLLAQEFGILVIQPAQQGRLDLP